MSPRTIPSLLTSEASPLCPSVFLTMVPSIFVFQTMGATRHRLGFHWRRTRDPATRMGTKGPMERRSETERKNWDETLGSSIGTGISTRGHLNFYYGGRTWSTVPGFLHCVFSFSFRRFERSRTTGHTPTAFSTRFWIVVCGCSTSPKNTLVPPGDARRHCTILCTVTRVTGDSWSPLLLPVDVLRPTCALTRTVPYAIGYLYRCAQLHTTTPKCTR